MKRALPLVALVSIGCTFDPPTATPGSDSGAIEDPLDATPADAAVDAGQDDSGLLEPKDAEANDGAPADVPTIDAGVDCGNGRVDPNEGCDDGNGAAGDGCSACTVESGWSCAGVQPSICDEVCGDGMVVGAEECDDQGTSGGDGCAAGCVLETGWSCNGEPSSCMTICGDGMRVGAELCDDGNPSDGDGCSSSCAVEAGFSCDTAQPTLCTAICGDGLVRGNERCDDGARAAGDGCAQNCRLEPGFYCEGEPSSCNRWWNATYLRRRSLTIDRAGITEIIEQVPLMVALTAQRIDYALTSPGGADLRFLADDQTTVLPHEIEVWDPAGTSFVWVRFPQIRAEGSTTQPDRIWMYYGGPNVASTIPPAQVWAEGHEAVWHLADLPTGAPEEIADSSGNFHRGRSFGMNAASSVAGRIGRALRFDGLNDLVDFGNIDPNNWTEISVEAWVYWTGASSYVVSMSTGTSPADHTYSLEAPAGTSARARITTDGDNSGNSQVSSAVGTLAPGTWHYVVSTWTAADPRLRLYVDGVLAASTTRDGERVRGSSDNVVVGNVNLAGSRWLEGVIDEVRLSRTARSASWVRAQYRSMSDQLAIHGAEQIAP